MYKLAFKNWIWFLISVSIVILASVSAFPQEGKIGYMDSMKLRTDYKEFADAQAKFDQEVAKWQAETDSIKMELDSLETEFNKQSLLLSDEKKKEKESQLKQKKDSYTNHINQVFGPGGKMEKLNAELTKPILDKINIALEKIALENNYVMIFDAVNGNVAWAKKGLDLTERVLEELNKMQ
ncbi:MAG: OmpH family outer membrane protein [candidate division Zixibacteria bacterium]|nr:OmpH family outer membrane protein [candidate division Zixibacteria bacterium]